MSNDTRARRCPKDEVVKTELGAQGGRGRGHRRARRRRPGRAPGRAGRGGVRGPRASHHRDGAAGRGDRRWGRAAARSARLVGALVGAGIPEERAKLYEKGIDEGGIVLGVTPRTDEDADYFEREWTNARGERMLSRPPSRRQGGDDEALSPARQPSHSSLALDPRPARSWAQDTTSAIRWRARSLASTRRRAGST